MESLANCIHSNAEGLKKAMKDLENLTDQVPESARSKNLTIEISETANKILFQFENFSEYTRTEVKKIIDQIIKRD